MNCKWVTKDGTEIIDFGECKFEDNSGKDQFGNLNRILETNYINRGESNKNVLIRQPFM